MVRIGVWVQQGSNLSKKPSFRFLAFPPPRVLAFLLFLLLATALFSFSRPVAHAAPSVAFSGSVVAESADAYIAYDPHTQSWEIGSRGIQRRMSYDPVLGFRLLNLTNRLTGTEWLPPSGTSNDEIRFQLGGETISGATRDLVFRTFTTRTIPDSSIELVITLSRGSLAVHQHYVVYPNSSTIEAWPAIENRSRSQILYGLADLHSLSFAFHPSDRNLQLYYVQGLAARGDEAEPDEPSPTLRLRSLDLTEGVSQILGATGRSTEDSMGWFVLEEPVLREGMFGGLEWSGAWRLDVKRANGLTFIQGGIDGLRADVKPGEIITGPRRFIGFYRGDLDDAANASHEFARDYLMRPHPDNFPWTQYNTWYAYYTDLNEEQLKREVDHAAELGVELFYIDAGWYAGSPTVGDFGWGLGTWRENLQKFPSGLAEFADYVHSKGMKFGLWVEPERIDLRFAGPGREVPFDWLAPEGLAKLPELQALDPSISQPNEEAPFSPPPDMVAPTAQVCLGHPEARAWMKEWLTRIIRDYHVDWLKWDYNVYQSCEVGNPVPTLPINVPGAIGLPPLTPGQNGPPNSSPSDYDAVEPGEGNYAHILGLYEVLDYVAAEFPDLIIENCASGGNRMDYGLMRRTHIAWLSDQTDPSYRVRYHVTGASYPFPPEYLNTWVVDSGLEPLNDEVNQSSLKAWMRSRMMGGFGLSVDSLEWSSDLLSLLGAGVAEYKTLRPIISHGDIYRLLPQSDLPRTDEHPPSEPDAAEFYNRSVDAGAVLLFQGAVPWEQRRVVLKGLDPDRTYSVRAADRTMDFRRTGQQLMTDGVRFRYEASRPSVLLYLNPVQ